MGRKLQIDTVKRWLRATRMSAQGLAGRKLPFIDIALMAGAVLLASGPVLAQPATVLPAAFATARVSGETRPVPAWLRFCEAQPSECQVDLAEPETVKLTRQVWQQMIAVNAKVNGSIRPLTDDDHWGVADAWGYPTDGYGDCEDYQLLKRKLLAEGGLPRRAMRMTVVIDEKGEGHAVLMIRTDRGDFILDNKSPSILPWYQTGYIFVKREGQEGSTWASLGGVMSPTTTANR